MARYLIARLTLSVPTLIAVSIIAFVLTTAARGDPALLALQQGGYDPTPELLQQYREMLGLDAPLPMRYFRWLIAVTHGDLGTSFISNRPVAEMLGERVLPTFALGAAALVLSSAVGIGLGLLLALSRSNSVDMGTRILVSFFAGIPSFWLAIGSIMLLGAKLRLLPVAGYGDWQHFLMPALALAVGPAAATLRLTRNSVLDVLAEDFVRTARAKGLTWRIIGLRHVLRCALLPILAFTGVRFGHLLAGAVIIEPLFAWPGMGSVLIGAISGRDLPVIGGYVLITGIPVIAANVITDVVSRAIDPRVNFDSRNSGLP